MPYKTVIFPRNDEADTFIAAANYLAIIAYPKDTEQHKNFRHDFCNACRAWWIRGSAGNMHAKGVHNADIMGFSRYTRMRNNIRKAQTIIADKREVAADIAKKLLLNPFAENKITITGELSKSIGRLPQKADPKITLDNAMHRTWSASQPVIHLTLGLTEALEQSGFNGHVSILDILEKPQWIWCAIEKSENIRKYLVASFNASRPMIEDKKTVQILCESKSQRFVNF